MVNFGCTGGRHRSVYCAEALAARMKKKYGARVELTHREFPGLAG
jgi:RNase adaptor protein for sRNA GlmZ degradation